MTTLRIGEKTIVVEGDVIRSESNNLFFLKRSAKRDAQDLFKNWKGEFELFSDERGTAYSQNGHKLEKIGSARYQYGKRPKISLL